MKRSEQWAVASPIALQDFVRKVVCRVVFGTDKIIVEASKRELRGALIETQLTSGDQSSQPETDERSDDLVRLEVATRLTRCGCEMRLLIPPDSQGKMEMRLVTPLLKAIARAHDWQEQLVTGKASTIRSIAEKTGLGDRYVARVLPCAFLAPDIIEAILNGSQPPDLTFAKLTRHVPLNWVDQRQQFGFAVDTRARRSIRLI
jgi:hypothetical protein